MMLLPTLRERLMLSGDWAGDILMLQGFFDDSGTNDPAPVIVWGGLIGPPERWDELSAAWRRMLNRPHPGWAPLKQFSTRDCRFGFGEFKPYAEAESEREAVMRGFREIVGAVRLKAVAYAIKKAAFQQFLSPEIRGITGNEEFSVLASCIKHLERLSGGSEFAVALDRGRMNQHTVELLNQVDDTYGNRHSHSFLVVKDTPPLQAADMVATEAFWSAKAMFCEQGEFVPRSHLSELIEATDLEAFFCGEEECLVMVENYRKTGKTVP